MWLLSTLMHSVIICPLHTMHVFRMSLPVSTEKGTSVINGITLYPEVGPGTVAISAMNGQSSDPLS